MVSLQTICSDVPRRDTRVDAYTIVQRCGALGCLLVLVVADRLAHIASYCSS